MKLKEKRKKPSKGLHRFVLKKEGKKNCHCMAGVLVKLIQAEGLSFLGNLRDFQKNIHVRSACTEFTCLVSQKKLYVRDNSDVL